MTPATISADYREFHPETFKGFKVRCGDWTSDLIGDYEDALALAHEKSNKVIVLSSVDNLLSDITAN